MTECPTCGGALYDNSAKVAGGWKGPLLKCNDAACGWVKWPPKSAAKAAGARGAKWTWGTLARTYERALLLAEKYVVASSKRTKLAFTTADLLAAAATLFIAASRDGVQEAVAASKATEAPLDQPPPALVAAAEDDDLPF
ncbi:MAG TPA: hypothetical protein VK531_12040 [Gemmatimonadales bacterium]|nr:hypothetical protein [Gemmatimonadales bacterium]